MSKHGGKMLKAWRESSGITQTALAEEANLTQGAISKFEDTGQARGETYRKIAAATKGGLTIEDLILGGHVPTAQAEAS